jgi:polyisoprenoid-binding protein YceI
MSAVPGTRHVDPAPAPASSGRWTVVPDASTATFHVRDKLVTTVHGTMPVQDGGVVVSDTGDVTHGWITVSVAGIATGNGRRDKDLLKPRLLDAERFPLVRITVDAASSTPDGWTAEGTVLARGVEVPVDLVAVPVEGDASASQVRVRVTGTLDRQPLSIKAPTILIGRYVHLDADLTLRRAQDDAPARDAGDA